MNLLIAPHFARPTQRTPTATPDSAIRLQVLGWGCTRAPIDRCSCDDSQCASVVIACCRPSLLFSLGTTKMETKSRSRSTSSPSFFVIGDIISKDGACDG